MQHKRDRWYIYILQGSVATQLRCDAIFSNHFITNFPQNVPVKKISKIDQYLATILWTKVVIYFFGATLYIRIGLFVIFKECRICAKCSISSFDCVFIRLS